MTFVDGSYATDEVDPPDDPALRGITAELHAERLTLRIPRSQRVLVLELEEVR